ncbi:MAG: response regulator [Anaerolineae bacterium]|nr:response regulator [Anaerolineae bacterium]
MSRILVVDDDTSLLQMMGLMLKRAGHTAILASDGHEGIEIAKKEKPDMAIIDIMMPDLSGYEVCTMLRKDPQTQDIPLLILTALSQHEYRKRAEASGADGFITKPVTRDDLVGNIEELLRTGAHNFPELLEEEDLFAEEEEEEKPAPPPGFEASAAPLPAPAQPVDVPSSPKEMLPLVAVVGLGSGVGATTVTVNLGLGLMQFGRSCILDFHHQAGHIAAQLNLISKGNWADLADVEPGGDKRKIAGTLTLEHPSGVAVLAAPPSATQVRLGGEGLHYIFNVLTEGFKRIIVDLPAGLDPMSVATLQEARNIVLVIGDSPANMANIPNAIAALKDLNLGGEIHLVLNHTRPHGVTHEAVMQALDAPLAADIPYEPAQVEAVTKGLPLIMYQPSSLFSRTILQLARQL